MVDTWQITWIFFIHEFDYILCKYICPTYRGLRNVPWFSKSLHLKSCICKHNFRFCIASSKFDMDWIWLWKVPQFQRSHLGRICMSTRSLIPIQLKLLGFFSGQHTQNPESLWCIFSGISFMLWLLEEVCRSRGTLWIYRQSCWGVWTSSTWGHLLSWYLAALLHIHS